MSIDKRFVPNHHNYEGIVCTNDHYMHIANKICERTKLEFCDENPHYSYFEKQCGGNITLHVCVFMKNTSMTICTSFKRGTKLRVGYFLHKVFCDELVSSSCIISYFERW